MSVAYPNGVPSGGDASRVLSAELRRRLGAPPELPEWPSVSIVVLNRDGAPMLRRLLCGLVERTDYPRFELIVVDNASTDDSLDFIRRVEAPFPISIVSNPHNESFSDACNQGVELTGGELLLFCNNDIEPFEPGWLRELVACQRESHAGAVTATLLCPEDEHRASFAYGYGVAARGQVLREEEDGMIHPALRGWEADPLDERLGCDEECSTIAAACLLIDRAAFEGVEGFSHGYVYGGEDVDLSLKLREARYRVLVSGRSLAIHHPVSTRRRAPFEEERARKLANRLLLWERWGPRLRREYELGRVEGGGEWPFGVCFRVADPAAPPDLSSVRVELEPRGWRSLVLEGERAEDPLGLNYEIAVHVHGPSRYVPKPAQRNVLWVLPGSIPPEGIERSRYELVVEGELERLLGALESIRPPSTAGLSLLSFAVTPQRF